MKVSLLNQNKLHPTGFVQSMRRGLLLVLFALVGMAASAQNIKVSGVVTDALTGEQLVGVNITKVGTTTGSVTDLDGNFSITVEPTAKLRFTYLGYKTKEVQLTGDTKLTVQLDMESNEIEELVVVGYSVMKKRDVLGAVSKVSSNELTALPVASTQEALQGRVAGVQVSSQTGAPGAGVSVRIRGTSSINASNEPLYVVDGVPLGEGALGNISPNEIESISVLKDASSAAVYGSRATNGVVLITTKSGAKGDAKINYHGQMGIQTHGRLTPMINTDEYLTLYNEMRLNDGKTRVNFNGDYANVDQLAQIFQVAPIHSHELSISGGTDKTKYLFAGTYFYQDGIIKTSNFERGNIRSNVTTDVRDWLQVGLNVSGGISNSREIASSGDGIAGGGGSVVRYALFMNPARPVFNTDGTYLDRPSDYYGSVPNYDDIFAESLNPSGILANTNRTRTVKTLLATGNVRFTLPSAVIWKNVLGVDYKTSNFRDINMMWGSDDRINNPTGLNVETAENTNVTFNSTFSRNFIFKDDHSLFAMVGFEAISETGYSLSGGDSGFLTRDLDFIYLGMGMQKGSSSSEGAWGSSLVSFFGNVNYNYKQRYFLSAILRQDGSSKFSAENRWGTFYSISGGWNIEGEEFMQDVEIVNKLKLRVGYGVIGNQFIPQYAYVDRLSAGSNYTFGGQFKRGFAQTAMGNADLKWETSKQFNAGVDLELLKGAVGVTVDYFYKITNDMLVSAPIPPSGGRVASPWINSGQILNTGVDMEIFYRKNYRDGGFQIAFNGGFLHNEVLKLDAPLFAGRIDNGVYATKTEVGYPVGSFYMYEMGGIFQNALEVSLAPNQGLGIKPGDVRYVDQNKDDYINEKDRVHLGSAIPTFTTGLTLSGNYKGFDLSIFFQGAFGQKIFSQVNQDIEGFYRGFGVTQRYYNERWTPENPSNTQPRASWAAKSNNVKASSRFLEDASYMRLKNLQLGYTIPNSKQWKIDNIRVYLAGTNLLTFTGYSGLDPEMTVSANSAGEGDMANGIDWGTYPVARTYTLGVNITF